VNKSQRLRSRDFRKIYRLIGECRDLGADPLAWQQRLLEGVMTLTGTRVAHAGRLFDFPTPSWSCPEMTQLGLEHDRLDLFQEFFRYVASEGDLLFDHVVRLPHDRVQTVTGLDVFDLDEWRRSEYFQKFHLAMDVEAGILSFAPIRMRGRRFHHSLTVRRNVGERWFSQREMRLLDYLHRELARELGRTLALPDEPSASELSPRMRETLRHLLDGLSEKQIARRMGISRATVHEYVTGLFRRFGASGRAELMARWIRYGTGTASAEDE
jgi:DNA-binding CsgD family transcriptional regulator